MKENIISNDFFDEIAMVDDIAKITVNSLDAWYNKTRDLMVRQRFALGMVEMFEALPDLKAVRININAGIADLVVPCDAADLGISLSEHQKLTKLVKAALQSTRAVICPQGRNSKDTIVNFFSRLSSSSNFIIEREIFTRTNLPRFCVPDINSVINTLQVELRSEALGGHVSPDHLSVAKPERLFKL